MATATTTTTFRMMTFALVCLFVAHLVIGASLAAPAVPSVSSAPSEQEDANEKQSTIVATKSIMRSSNTEKLKRGLSSFLNQLNPAPFFVPAVPLHQLESLQHKANASGDTIKQVAAKGQVGANGSSQVSSSDLAAIVNGDSSADVLLIKGSNRLAQTRPIGGPLRWGRR